MSSGSQVGAIQSKVLPSPDQEGESIYNCGEPAPLHVGRLVHLDPDAGRGVVLVHTATEIETLKK